MSNTLNLGDGKWAAKEGSLLAYNSENGNFKPLPFTFDRSTSATRVNKEGLIEVVSNNEPRIDFLNDSKGALLLEPLRRNLIPFSQDFSVANWVVGSGATKEYNVAISPDGTQNASRFNFDGTFNGRVEYSSVGGITNGTTYTISVYLKSESGTIENVKIGHSSWGLEDVTVTNEWTRFTQTVVSSTTNAYPRIRVDAEASVLVWGYQLEDSGLGIDASYATSYIPTQGSIGTRVAESCGQNPVSGIIGQTELTVFYKGIVERLGGNDGHAIALSQSADAAGSSRILLYRNSYGDMYVYVQDTTTVFSTPLLVNSNPQINDKYAIAIKDNDLVIYCNGVKVAENNSGTIPTMQYIYLNEWSNQINQKNITQEVKLYNTRLTNAELQTLTKI